MTGKSRILGAAEPRHALLVHLPVLFQVFCGSRRKLYSLLTPYNLALRALAAAPHASFCPMVEGYRSRNRSSGDRI